MSTSTGSRRVLLIGIDGGCWSLLNRAIDAGAMPCLKALREQGSWGNLLSTIPPKTPAAWGAFQTGRNPGANGVFDFAWWDRASRQTRCASAASLEETIWEIAGRAGRRVGLLNVPMTYPPRPIPGMVVCGLLTPSMDSEWTYPPSLKSELLKAVPGYHIFNLDDMPFREVQKNPELFLSMMSDAVDKRGKAARFLLEQEPFDVFMVHFQASDVVQHGLWGFLSPDHPDYNEAVCRLAFERFYRKLDEEIQHTLELFQKRSIGPTVTFVLSDHGFQTHRKRVHLGYFLVEKGFLRVKQPDFSARMKNWMSCLTGRRIPSRPDFDWERSRVFSFSQGNDGFLYFLEENQSARLRTEEELRRSLDSLSDPETGQKVVRHIWRREELYRGKYADRMPDWVLQPIDGYSFTGDYAASQKELFRPVQLGRDFHIGMHHPEGILAVFGDSVKQGISLQGVRLIDLAPTILALLGTAVPAEMEGRVLTELFCGLEDSARTAGSQPPNPAVREEGVYSDEEAAQIEKRLRDLGYIE
ncbi:MAG: alkaline phosphatase family protein [Anaerohalosphaeraceae bacterium]